MVRDLGVIHISDGNILNIIIFTEVIKDEAPEALPFGFIQMPLNWQVYA